MEQQKAAYQEVECDVTMLDDDIVRTSFGGDHVIWDNGDWGFDDDLFDKEYKNEKESQSFFIR